MNMQFFTSDKMVVVSFGVFLIMLWMAAKLIQLHDREVWWVVSFEIFQTMFVIYYAHQWQLGTDAIDVVPDVNLLVRPALVSLWFLIIIYSGVRLYFKLKL